mgnify:CR=1 FL=1
MPVTYGTFQKQLKLLPLTLHADGRATVSVRYGYVGADGVFTPSTEQAIEVDADGVGQILDAPPVPGLSRRDDLSFAVYSYLVSRSLIDAGEVS